MPNWEYMKVQVYLVAGSSTYTVLHKDKDGSDEERSLSEFLLDMAKQDWEYVELNDNVVTLRRPKQ